MKKYTALLEQDFAAHKIVVCAYQSSILRTVQTLLGTSSGAGQVSEAGSKVTSASNKRRP